METNWAAGHLQVIRTLMERAAIYRRALAPVMLFLGLFGLAAALLAIFLEIPSDARFGYYWICVGLIGLPGAYLMIRRQALKESESFWSPPTRRVTQALLPSAFSGFAASILFIRLAQGIPGFIHLLPPVWMLFYGCALHAAGFFMPRGMKLFGWGFILTGCLAGALVLVSKGSSLLHPNWLMGITFGGFHLAYGIYLFFTEKRTNEV